jgi:ElaB/YqjD/DUF883 family membrane-anchored ribosome-binding protein
LSKKKHSVEEIHLRKQKLQQEIDLIEQKYSKKATKISNGIQNTLKPIQTIRDNPLRSLGISVAVGLILGLSGRSKRSSSKTSSTDDSGSGNSDNGFSSLLMSELKRMAAKRAMMYISDIVDRKVMPEIRRTESGQTESSSHQSKDL